MNSSSQSIHAYCLDSDNITRKEKTLKNHHQKWHCQLVNATALIFGNPSKKIIKIQL